MKLSRSAAHRRIVTGWVTRERRPPVIVERRSGPERVKITGPEKTKPRPFEAALAPLRWAQQRRAADQPQPPTPARWYERSK
jgi:hypothetical protein